MSIAYDEQSRVFSLSTANALYQMKVDGVGVLLHLYYGRQTGADMSYLLHSTDRGFSGNPYEMRSARDYSLDLLPQEYSGSGVGDYRLSALQTIADDGSRSVDLRYRSHRILRGVRRPEGLPGVRAGDSEESLEITLSDDVLGLTATLVYGVFESEDVIARSVLLRNEGARCCTSTAATAWSASRSGSPCPTAWRHSARGAA